MAPLFDIAVNFGASALANKTPEIVQQALAANVSKMIALGCSIQGSHDALTVAQHYPDVVYSTAGIHPHDAKTFDDSSLAALRSLASLPQVVALGECGLDFNRDFSPRDQQKSAFEAQLKLAVELQMPVVMHQRDAHEAFVEILKKYRSQLSQVVVHCFTGTHQELLDYINLDCHIGITGWICDERRGLHLLESVPSIPDNRLMLETDSPYLMPRNIKPKPKSRNNRPANLYHIAGTVAAARKQSVEMLRRNCYNNSLNFFNLTDNEDQV
ncbi:TatD family hydrolase [Psychrobium sp. nBUS_13]|uniref:TatD family hydrolase n=1 Tax=Psychrobium sp. nBUS_13 TaxID=3395319 RepID=UPI003EBB5066